VEWWKAGEGYGGGEQSASSACPTSVRTPRARPPLKKKKVPFRQNGASSVFRECVDNALDRLDHIDRPSLDIAAPPGIEARVAR